MGLQDLRKSSYDWPVLTLSPIFRCSVVEGVGEPIVTACTCHPSTEEVEAGGSPTGSQPGICNKVSFKKAKQEGWGVWTRSGIATPMANLKASLLLGSGVSHL